ncbi:MAG: ABC transporter permease [Clostridiales bacterium]|nr:ABC transporter permease [Clostridiales bacterium]
MNMLRYALLHLQRNLRSAVIAFACYLMVLAVILFVQQSALSRQQMLEQMASSLEVRGEIADSFGIQTELLMMDKSQAMMFLEGYSISKLIKDVSVKGNYQCLVNGEAVQLMSITGERADQTLYYDGEMIYEEGFDDSVWRTREAVCAVSTELLPLCYERDGSTYLDVTGWFYSTYYKEYIEAPMTLKVIAQAVTFNRVYCPYLMLQDFCAQLKGVTYWADSLAFTIKDNTRMDELRKLLLPYFGDSDIESAGSKYYTVIIKDAEYLKLTSEAQKSMEIMALMQPVLYLCALGTGVMLVVMQMRGRKKEMAVIRSLGAGRLRVMAQSILEYAIICLPVTLFALLVWRELSPMTVLGVWLAFMAGALMTIIRFTQIPLVKQIRELEE